MKRRAKLDRLKRTTHTTGNFCETAYATHDESTHLKWLTLSAFQNQKVDTLPEALATGASAT